MKPTFHHRLVNGPFEDPLLYVRLLWQRRAMLFDVGTVSRLRAADILKVTDIFVTHTHIDHFIGFDAVLRVLLRRPQPLRVYGPEAILDCVEGKLRGYAWNLIRDYPIQVEVFGVSQGGVRRASFHAENSFGRVDGESFTFDGTLLREPGFRVRAAILSHDIQCLAYSLEEDFHINIDKAALLRRGLPVGPWLADLKAAVRRGAPGDVSFEVEGATYTLDSLRDMVMTTRGQKFTYVTDASPEKENIDKITELARGSDTLYCEAYFVEADRERARERSHLTGRLAGRIARESGSRSLVAMHFSPKYRGSHISPEKEAMEEFRGGRRAEPSGRAL
ncbi:MAG: ribonuclease Z [Thermodesulfovibrionales bacterium]